MSEYEAHIRKLIEGNGGFWGEHPGFPVEDWRNDVANGDTRMGYWEWVAAQLEAQEND
jgi:hypothetical protein